MTVIFNNFIVPRISLSLFPCAERKLYTASSSLSAHPDNHSFSARPSAPPREMTEVVGKEVANTRCKYPSNYAIRKIPARRGSIARRGKVCCCCCFFFSLQHHLHLPHLSPPRRIEHTSDSSSDILVTCLFCNYYVLAPGIPMYIIAD